MTASTEADARDSGADATPLAAGAPSAGQAPVAPGRDWRGAARAAQRAVLPAGRVVVSCSAPLGSGGLGRHVSELVEALHEQDRSAVATRISGESHEGWSGRALAMLPLPVSPGLRTRAFMVEFDAYAARRLPPAEHLIAFNGQASAQFRAARRARYASVGLVAANSHMRQVIAQHELARRQYPLEGSWARHMLDRNLAEYEQADRIYFASDYIRDSFVERGVPAERLSRFPLTPAPRYAPGGERSGTAPGGEQRSSGRFEIVYVGSLAVHKGVPLLIDALRRLPHADVGLRLVGGWGTRGMRRFVQSACAADDRITVCPGDPLPHLRAAALCVHPAYEDGFAYAPAEALACGVPVIVSADTGMKQLIDSPRRGLTLPTGDLDALVQAIEAAYRGELFAG